MRGGGGVIGLVMGATGTTERERLLGRGTRTMVCAFIPASDGRISSSASRRVASRRVVLPVHGKRYVDLFRGLILDLLGFRRRSVCAEISPE